jgi:hypothetical protein
VRLALRSAERFRDFQLSLLHHSTERYALNRNTIIRCSTRDIYRIWQLTGRRRLEIELAEVSASEFRAFVYIGLVDRCTLEPSNTDRGEGSEQVRMLVCVTGTRLWSRIITIHIAISRFDCLLACGPVRLSHRSVWLLQSVYGYLHFCIMTNAEAMRRFPGHMRA